MSLHSVSARTAEHPVLSFNTHDAALCDATGGGWTIRFPDGGGVVSTRSRCIAAAVERGFAEADIWLADSAHYQDAVLRAVPANLRHALPPPLRRRGRVDARGAR